MSRVSLSGGPGSCGDLLDRRLDTPSPCFFAYIAYALLPRLVSSPVPALSGALCSYHLLLLASPLRVSPASRDRGRGRGRRRRTGGGTHAENSGASEAKSPHGANASSDDLDAARGRWAIHAARVRVRIVAPTAPPRRTRSSSRSLGRADRGLSHALPRLRGSQPGVGAGGLLLGVSGELQLRGSPAHAALPAQVPRGLHRPMVGDARVVSRLQVLLCLAAVYKSMNI
jgi:hypothetical protein